jgi:hypothetical protein
MYSLLVIPAEAGIQKTNRMLAIDSRLHGDDIIKENGI